MTSMVVYGRNPVREALRGRRTVARIWATPKLGREAWLAQSGVSLQITSAEEIERRCGSSDHQGVCAEVSAFVYADPAALLAEGPGLIVVLDQVQDPQNLGSICRTAECAGTHGVVIPERRSAEVTPAVCKASAGAVEHLSVARARNLTDFLGQAKRADWWCYGADAEAASSYEAMDYADAAVLVLGAEGRGLRPRVAAACDALIRVPLRGQIESLNVAAAAAILIYAVSTGPV